MEIDQEKVHETVLALLYLWSWKEYGAQRTWKGMDWDVMNELYDRGWISDPHSKAKSVVLSDEGVAKAQEFLTNIFSRLRSDPDDTGGADGDFRLAGQAQHGNE